MFYADRNADSGILTINTIFNHTQASNFRNYIRNVRGTAFSLPAIGGISKPFGVNGPSFPTNVKVKSFKDELMNVNYWNFKIEFLQDFKLNWRFYD